MRAHRLKIWPENFVAQQAGELTNELRGDDRDFQVGDRLLLEEFDPKTGTKPGRDLGRKITHITRDVDGLMPGYCVLSTVKAEPIETAHMRNNAAVIEWIEPK